MACKQLFGARVSAPSSTLTTYCGPTFAPFAWDSALAVAPWQVDGTFRNARIDLVSAPGIGNSLAFTLVHNGSDSALSITIAGASTSGTNTVDTVAVSAGDTLYWRCVPSSAPTVSMQRASCEFWGTTAGESGYASLLALNATQTWRGPLFSTAQWNTGTGVTNFELVAAAGDLTALAYELDTAPGGAASYTFTVYKNGVAQDGSGGTVNTVETISGASTTGAWTGTLALAAGDYVWVEVVPASTPAVARLGFAAKFEAPTDGESQCCALVYDDLPASGGPYFASPHHVLAGAWDLTESDADAAASGASSFVLRAFRVRLSSTVATGPLTFALRINSANAGPSVTLNATDQIGADGSNTATLVSGDEWGLSYSVSGTPGISRTAAIAMVMFALTSPPTIVATHIIGSDVTVQGATHAVVVGVRGTAVTHTRPNIFAVYDNVLVAGYIELLPITAPGAPTAGMRLYVDAADGDTKVIHANSNIDVIAAN